MGIEQELQQSYEDLLESHTRLQSEVAHAASALRTFATLPVGTILPFFGELADLDGTDWVACTAANQAQNPRVPNLEGRFLMGVADGPGTLGGRADIPNDGEHAHGGSTVGTDIAGYMPGHAFQAFHGESLHNHTHGIASDAKGTHAHGGENRPPFFGAYFIIRVKQT